MRQVRHKGKKQKGNKRKKKERGSVREKKRFFFEVMIQTSKIQTRAKTFENTTCTIL
jgi:hypothetical protein